MPVMRSRLSRRVNQRRSKNRQGSRESYRFFTSVHVIHPWMMSSKQVESFHKVEVS
jgi:hypothetical protein